MLSSQHGTHTKTEPKKRLPKQYRFHACLPKRQDRAGHSAPKLLMFANLKPRVLIVDDEPQLRSALMAALADRTEHVASAASAHEALLAIESGEYDIVLSDMYMPHASGLDLLN